MRKTITKVLMMAAVFTVSMGITAMAGSWRGDSVGMWYQNDDGSYTTKGWQWIDSDYDGMAECYYFNGEGYLFLGTTTPDGYTVNENGAWVENGVVQTKSMDELRNSNVNLGFDQYWYDKDENLSEGDKAYYHYRIVHCTGESIVYETLDKINEQLERIVADPTPATAEKEMVWVEIPVWRLRNGQKEADTTKVQVLSSIADEVKTIFTDIFNGPEQFPINSIGGYDWRSNGLNSDHSVGLAIDINPNQNPQVSYDGTVLVGNKWQPGVNPYSISRDSDVLKAFGKFDWAWEAGYTTKDYMHFSWY